MRSARNPLSSRVPSSRGTAPARSVVPARLVATAGLVVTLGLAGCAVGPDPGPALVPGGGNGGGPAASTTSSTPAQAPTLQKPGTDLAWGGCAGAPAAPAGVTLQCAELDSPVNPDNPRSTLTVHFTRASVADTPADAAPLVLTAGTDMPSSRALRLLADGPGRSLLNKHPIVAVDRRGIPDSTPLDCLTRSERVTLADNGLTAGADTAKRITDLADAASSASDGCTETLTPDQLQFGITAAASDIETLRQRWNVPTLGLIGLGEGSDVAIAYTALYGGRTGRLVLDTPTPFGANARDAGAVRASGVQAALVTFAQRCGALGAGCPLGTAGVATMGDVLTKGRTGALGGLSDTQALAAITTGLALAPNDTAGLTSVASAIAAADNGDVKALTDLANQAEELRLTDGQVVSVCNDVTGPVGQNEVAGLVTAWTKQNPLTGTDTALSLVRCNGWASSEPVNPPESFPVAPLVLLNSGDPINGGEGVKGLSPLFARAGTTPVTVDWNGLGYSVLARSTCAADVVAQYVAHSPLEGPADRGCPA
ncbi:alpha/beta hydrolase [Gordonia desulfuricans]